MKRVLLITLGAGVFLAASSAAQSIEFRPEIALETRLFTDPPQFEDQLDVFQGSLILTGDASWRSEDRKTRIRVEPFARIDTADSERSYFDLREASLSYEINRDWDVVIGVSQVFWGVAESRNVVDIINQFDTVEDIDEGEKLGQPMIRLTRRSDVGTFEAYYLPFFRERTLPGEEGRLRFALPVDAEIERFERSGGRWAGDFALRYTNRFGDIDLGLHAFHGTSRNPLLEPSETQTTLEPLYPELTQGGIDAQWTRDAWLLKGEAVVGTVLGETLLSAVAGFEYTFFDIAGRGWDVGLIGEYLFDNRDQSQLPITLFENDIFAGTRVTLNDSQDTEFLAGAIVDHKGGGVFASAEFQRRLGDQYLFEVEARLFVANDDPFITSIARDDHFLVRLTRYF